MTNHPNRSNERVTLTDLDGTSKRVTLPSPHFEETCTNSNGYNNIQPGVWVTGLYAGPRTGRKFIRTYSCWDNGRGMCVGTTYRELDESQYLDMCERVGCEPQGVTPSEA